GGGGCGRAAGPGAPRLAWGRRRKRSATAECASCCCGSSAYPPRGAACAMNTRVTTAGARGKDGMSRRRGSRPSPAVPRLRTDRVLAANELADEEGGRDVVQLLPDLVGEMSADSSAARTDSLVLGQFNDDRHAREVLRQSLTAATLPGALRLRGALGRDSGLCGRNRVITLLG